MPNSLLDARRIWSLASTAIREWPLWDPTEQVTPLLLLLPLTTMLRILSGLSQFTMPGVPWTLSCNRKCTCSTPFGGGPDKAGGNLCKWLKTWEKDREQQSCSSCPGIAAGLPKLQEHC